MVAILSIGNLAYAEQHSKIKKNVEDYFEESYNCVKKGDRLCAQVGASNIASQSPYSNLLIGIFACLDGDFDTAFRELLPLQSNTTLNSKAYVSLHISLAVAYENQSDSLRAIEQRALADTELIKASAANQEEIRSNQEKIWEIISVLSRTTLTEMRGNSPDSIIQGWIDLALATKLEGASERNEQAIERWQKAYADHPANESIAKELFPTVQVKQKSLKNKLHGAVGLLLPFSDQGLYPFCDAIERGFSAAKANANEIADIKIYISHQEKVSIEQLYKKANDEGVKYLIGSFSKEEENIARKLNLPIKTLFLSPKYSTIKSAYDFGFSAIDEIRQIVKTARSLGMQRVTIISSTSSESSLIAKNFSEAWLESGGESSNIAEVDKNFDGEKIKNITNEKNSDVFFIATDNETARYVRPFMNPSIPAFGTSQIYSGIPIDFDDNVLKGIRFIDSPWVLDRENQKFVAYKEAASDLPTGEAQRWFALGADAYQILINFDPLPKDGISIDGLSGKIDISASGEIIRTLSNASFTANGVVLESSESN
jgi:outer membrane PBP1 activator LpoA protein